MSNLFSTMSIGRDQICTCCMVNFLDRITHECCSRQRWVHFACVTGRLCVQSCSANVGRYRGCLAQNSRTDGTGEALGGIQGEA